jgi:hypothetical protein
LVYFFQLKDNFIEVVCRSEDLSDKSGGIVYSGRPEKLCKYHKFNGEEGSDTWGLGQGERAQGQKVKKSSNAGEDVSSHRLLPFLLGGGKSRAA